MLSPKDKIAKASWMLMEVMKDLTITTLAQAVQEGKLKLDQSQHGYLQSLLKQTIEAGYNRAFPSFAKTIDEALDETKKK